MTEAGRTRAGDIQTMFWLQQMRRPERCSANIPALVRVTGAFDEDRFRVALERIMQRHEIFRTSFAWDGAQLQQVVYEKVDVPLFKADPVSGSELDERTSTLNMHRFRHDETPLFRVTLLESGDGDRFVHALMHHSIYDLHTQSLFQSELAGAWRDERLEPVAAHYVDFADAELVWKSSAAAARQREFWRRRVAGFPVVPHPEPRGPADGASVDEPPGSSYLELDPDLAERVRDLSAERGWTPFLVLGACYQIALADWFRVDDFGIGVPFTNRRNRSVAAVAGCCMNVLPIRATIAATDSLETIVARFRREMLLGHRNQELSILEVMSLAGRPLYRFGFTTDAPLELDLDGCVCHPVDCERPGALVLFCHLYANRPDQTIRIRADYDGLKVGRADAGAFCSHLAAVVDRAVESPRASLAELGIGR